MTSSSHALAPCAPSASNDLAPARNRAVSASLRDATNASTASSTTRAREATEATRAHVSLARVDALAMRTRRAASRARVEAARETCVCDRGRVLVRGF